MTFRVAKVTTTFSIGFAGNFSAWEIQGTDKANDLSCCGLPSVPSAKCNTHSETLAGEIRFGRFCGTGKEDPESSDARAIEEEKGGEFGILFATATP